jgi:hypothetical protein
MPQMNREMLRSSTVILLQPEIITTFEARRMDFRRLSQLGVFLKRNPPNFGITNDFSSKIQLGILGKLPNLTKRKKWLIKTISIK